MSSRLLKKKPRGLDCCDSLKRSKRDLDRLELPSRKLREPGWQNKRKKRLSVKEEDYLPRKKLGFRLKDSRMKKRKD